MFKLLQPNLPGKMAPDGRSFRVIYGFNSCFKYKAEPIEMKTSCNNVMNTGLYLGKLQRASAFEICRRNKEYGVCMSCEEMSVELTSKYMAEMVHKEHQEDREYFDACLIDDDELVRMTWEFSAKESGANILTFDSFESFLKKSSEIDFETPVSIDVHLGENIRGTVIADLVAKLGFNKIYLATGFDADQIEGEIPSCVVAVNGKSPMFAKCSLAVDSGTKDAQPMV